METSGGERRYAMSVRRDAATAPPDDWQRRVAELDGVEACEKSARLVQFTASPEGAEAVQSAFGDCCHIEEITDRSPL